MSITDYVIELHDWRERKHKLSKHKLTNLLQRP